jgi:TonB family protein
MTPSQSSAVAQGRSQPAVDWKQCVGEIVHGKFPLQQLLGSSDHSAVFLTQPGEHLQKAAIKLLPAAAASAEAYLARWKDAARLSHPHLISIYDAGQCELAGRKMVFVLMEYAEENLAQILPQRPLTPDECREMLQAALASLSYLHAKGFVHAHFQPSNILAARDQLKISTDGLIPAGAPAGLITPGPYNAPEIPGSVSPASDMWSVGMTVIESLTQRLPFRKAEQQAEPVVPAAIPAPFGDIARNCLRFRPDQRWRLDQVETCLNSPAGAAREGPSPREPQPARSYQPLHEADEPGSSRRWIWLVLAAFVAIAAVLLLPRLRNDQPSLKPPVQSEASQQSSAALSAATPAAPTPANAGSASPASAPGSVAHEVLPAVSASARQTITGHVRVNVRVTVDDSGNVVAAKFDSVGPSKYFARLAMEAAQKWTFTPPQQDGHAVESQWLLRFEFGRTTTRAFAAQSSTSTRP